MKNEIYMKIFGKSDFEGNFDINWRTKLNIFLLDVFYFISFARIEFNKKSIQRSSRVIIKMDC